jgi:hypothetical protein
MNRVHWERPRASVILLCGACALLACHRHHDGDPLDADGGASAPRTPDHLGPGELVDGPLRAFELKLPAGMEVRETFATVVYAWGQVDPMRLANYLRAQVKGGSISVGAAATVFDRVTVPANTKRILRLRVDAAAQGHAARLEVRDITPPPLPSASSEAERWRQVGMTPDGKLLDPTHLH